MHTAAMLLTGPSLLRRAAQSPPEPAHRPGALISEDLDGAGDVVGVDGAQEHVLDDLVHGGQEEPCRGFLPGLAVGEVAGGDRPGQS